MISLTADQIDGLRRWCRKPGGKRRGTCLRLRACVGFDMHFNRSVSTNTMCRWLNRLGLTRKKGSRVALQQDPERVALFWETCQNLCFTDASEKLRTRSVRSFLDPLLGKKKKENVTVKISE
jgi:hypothetical protein